MKNTNLKLNYENIEEFVFENIPVGEWEVFAYTYVYVFSSDAIIHLILKSVNVEQTQFCIVPVNVKSLKAYPLSRIIKNQQLSNQFLMSQDINLNIKCDLTKEVIRKPAGTIPELSNFISSLPLDLKFQNYKYYPRREFSRQWFTILKDMNSDKIIFFPEYEIIRAYYFTSSSMTRAIIRSKLDTLYHGSPKLDETGTGFITLKNMANNNDAANIFRFAIDSYAYDQWISTKAKMALNATILQDETKKQNTNKTYLGTTFPTKQILNLKISARKIDEKHYVALYLIEEDSSYPFDKLNVTRETHESKNNFQQTIEKNRPNLDKETIRKINNDKPNTVNETTLVNTEYVGGKTVSHIGLANVDISFFNRKEEKLNDSNLKTNYTQDNNINEYSFHDSTMNGKLNTAPAEALQIVEEQDNNEQFQKTNDQLDTTLQNFQQMIQVCVKNLNASLESLITHIMPEKSNESNSKKAKNISNYQDNKPRHFCTAIIKFKDNLFTLIEVERDDTYIKSIGTLVLYNIDNNKIDDIIQSFVDTGGTWNALKNKKEYRKRHIPHRKIELFQEENNQSGIVMWASRVEKWLTSICTN